MKNYEKYADEIKEYNGKQFCKGFINPYILKPLGLSCADTVCARCRMIQTIWLMEEYEKPKVDWSKVEVDALILVRDDECGEWERRHFAEFKDGIIYAWADGRTSWSAEGEMFRWDYVKLAESDGDA